MIDKKFMEQALDLAKLGEGWTSPNPMVGAVIVKNGQIIGKGFHEKFGGNHAEVNAIKSAKENCDGAEIYISLEPCSHHGKTPPCIEAIIKAGIKKVVFAAKDPNLSSINKSERILKKAGINVESGVLEATAKKINEQYFYFHENQKPFIALKFASSLDGKLATNTNDSKWITNETARKKARYLRSKYQAILVGAKTVIEDDPHLGSRQKNKKDPLRIILDSTLSTNPKSQVYRDENVIIFCTKQADDQKIKNFEKTGIKVINTHKSKISVEYLVRELKKLNVISVLVEGGGKVLGSFLDSQQFNRVYAFYAPIIVGGDKSTSISGTGFNTIEESPRLKNTQLELLGDNFLLTGDYLA